MNVPHDALFQNCINGSTPLNRRAQDKKYFKTSEPMVQIQNNFTEMFLTIPSTKIAHNTLYQNCSNGSALLNKRAARAPDPLISIST